MRHCFVTVVFVSPVEGEREEAVYSIASHQSQFLFAHVTVFVVCLD